MGEKRGDAYRALVRKPEGTRPLGRPRLRWEDNIKIELKVIGWVLGLDWSGSVMDSWRASVDSAMNLQVHLKCEEFLE